MTKVTSFRSFSRIQRNGILSLSMTSPDHGSSATDESSSMNKVAVDGGIHTFNTNTNNRVLKTQSTVNEIGGSFAATMFRFPPSVGAGLDERFNQFSTDSEQDKNAAILSDLDMSYAQMEMKTALLSSDISTADKFSYASSAYAVSKEWRPLQVHAGGLMNDWTFNLE